MIMTYTECINKYGTDYRVKKEIEAGRLFRKEKGIYTDEAHCSDLDIIQTKYPRAIFTGESAYYYYNLTAVIPDDYHLATVRTDSRIKDSSVKQYFINGNLFEEEYCFDICFNEEGANLFMNSCEQIITEKIIYQLLSSCFSDYRWGSIYPNLH